MAEADRQHNAAGPSALLGQHPFFSALSPAEIEAATRGLEHVSIPQGVVFVHEGEQGECAYVLVAGVVEIIKALGTADERSFGLRGPGETIGEMSLFDPETRRSASVRAHTPIEALVITRPQFDALLTQYPKLNLELVRIMGRRLRTSESATIRDLQEKNAQLNQAYLELKAAQQKLVEQEVLARELAHAQRIQLQMLPAELPYYPGVEIGAAIRAARSVGGDLYEVIGLGPDRLAVVIGDVSGKGIPAALYMALVTSLLRAEAGQQAAPETVVRRVNAHLCSRDMDSMFVTLLYCELNLPQRCLTIVRAGHERPLLWSGATAVPPAGAGRSMALGLVDNPVLEVEEIVLPPAATFVMYTDGVTDAIDANVQPFGRTRLAATIERNLHLPAQGLCDALVSTVLAYHGVMPQFDDVTVLALRME